jgi:sugar lactone lactonase YvrE
MMTKRKVVLSVGVIFLGIMTYILFWPVSISPTSWHSNKTHGYVDDFVENTLLDNVTLITSQILSGPEDITFDSQGRLYTGNESGEIVRFSNQSGHWVEESFVDTNGRPLGMRFGKDNRLYVADASRGLLSITSTGEIKVLVSEFDGKKLLLVDHLAIGQSGVIYFSDASNKYNIDQAAADIIEHAARGRVYAYNLNTGVTNIVLDNLNFANGVALSNDETFLLVTETGSYRILKYYLKGDRQGEFEILHDNLPGLPDNISRDDNGHFWVALVLTRNPLLDWMSEYPFLRKAIYRIPESLLINPAAVAHAIQIDGNGKVLKSLQSRNNEIEMVTSAVLHDGVLYLGSLKGSAIGSKKLD